LTGQRIAIGLVILIVILPLSGKLYCQVSDPAVSAQAPIPGSGHHYIGIGGETVNPADGSLSFDLPLNPAPGRGLSMPFGISYLSQDLFSPTYSGFSGNAIVVGWQQNPTSYREVAGWSYLLPAFPSKCTHGNMAQHLLRYGCLLAPPFTATFQETICFEDSTAHGATFG
jgi:hypothetical protein